MIDINKLTKNTNELGLNILNSKEELKNFTAKDKLKLVDNEGYKYGLTSSNIRVLFRRKTKPNKFFHNNIYTYDNINNYLKINNIELRLISTNPKTATEKLEFECLKHHIVFKRSWNVIKNGSIFCNKCLLDYRRKTRGLSLEFIKDNWLNKWNVTLISNKYINNIGKLEYVCNKHKDKGIQSSSWASSLDCVHLCKYCLKEIVSKKIRKSNNKFLQEIQAIHGDKYTILTEYKTSKDKILVHCNKCDNDFEIQPNHLLEGHGCKLCTKSKGEERIENYLKNININYIREYRFDDCKGIKRKLPFDFYLPNYNICIEYQGEQHYKSIEIFGGKSQLEIQQTNDNIKKDYCYKNNIKLIEIPYWDYNNIEIILENKLKVKLRKKE